MIRQSSGLFRDVMVFIKCDDFGGSCINNADAFFRWNGLPGRPWGARCKQHNPGDGYVRWGMFDVEHVTREEYIVAQVMES